MHNFIIAVYAVVSLLVAALAHAGDKKCVKVYGKTPTEAFAAAAQLAAEKDAELGGKNCLRADTTIQILPETKNGLYVAELQYSLDKGSCEVKPESQSQAMKEEGLSP
jgi:hypothetical protein